MRNRTAVAVTIVGLALALASPAQAQKKNELNSRSGQSRGAATTNENIKVATGVNDKAVAIPEPGKGSAKRGAGQGLCPMVVHNRTGLWVNIYTDGNPRGQVAPWTGVTGWVGCGSTTFYAMAPYSDGSYRDWGPSRGYVSGPFLWTIWP